MALLSIKVHDVGADLTQIMLLGKSENNLTTRQIKASNPYYHVIFKKSKSSEFKRNLHTLHPHLLNRWSISSVLRIILHFPCVGFLFNYSVKGKLFTFTEAENGLKNNEIACKFNACIYLTGSVLPLCFCVYNCRNNRNTKPYIKLMMSSFIS